MPLLSLLNLSQPVSMPFMTVMLWGRMRGAITLTLALGVTENDAIDPEVQQFVAVLATGFVLFTLLRLWHHIEAADQLFWSRLAVAAGQCPARPGASACRLERARGRGSGGGGIPDRASVAERVQATCQDRMDDAPGATAAEEDILDRDRITVGLVSISNREREIVLRHLRQRTASIHTAETLLAKIGNIADRARAGGRIEYNRAARDALAFPRTMRMAQWCQRRLKYEGWLARLLADRYEMLLLSRIGLDELMAFNRDKISALLGARVAEILNEILAN
ncbi:MAG: sodium:proton antiporter, partial [Alphaproteobacteria bacterium]|nr:sodium:proton antiporter [Alphaproteobacteria bacterium]